MNWLPKRIKVVFLIIVAIIVVGTIGFKLIGGG